MASGAQQSNQPPLTLELTSGEAECLLDMFLEDEIEKCEDEGGFSEEQLTMMRNLREKLLTVKDHGGATLTLR
jgi:hypothetical protein